MKDEEIAVRNELFALSVIASSRVPDNLNLFPPMEDRPFLEGYPCTERLSYWTFLWAN